MWMKKQGYWFASPATSLTSRIIACPSSSSPSLTPNPIYLYLLPFKPDILPLSWCPLMSMRSWQCPSSLHYPLFRLYLSKKTFGFLINLVSVCTMERKYHFLRVCFSRFRASLFRPVHLFHSSAKILLDSSSDFPFPFLIFVPHGSRTDDHDLFTLTFWFRFSPVSLNPRCLLLPQCHWCGLLF